MLSKEEQERLTRVGPGTPMGNLLRRYWWPVGFSERLTTKPQHTKLLGEELVLYRAEDGPPVLMELRCAHRNVALDYGRVEGDCIRCPYHGWLYDPTGQCVEQPAEPEASTFKDRVKLNGYQAREMGGLVFGYLGPTPAPLLPRYAPIARTDGEKFLQSRQAYCNWFQNAENIVDISHLAWLHGARFPKYGARKVSYDWEETPYGLNNVMHIEGIELTHISCYVFPSFNRFTLDPVDGELVQALIYRVPVDDEHTMVYMVRFRPNVAPSLKTLGLIPSELGKYNPLESDWWGIDFSDQDRMAVEQQGTFTNRQVERLGASDRGLVLLRQMMQENIAAVEAGRDPLGVRRGAAQDEIINFPAQCDMFGEPELAAVGAR
ncbi:MAG TPA: Rieske 2Fe-2S domain-containing protein [Chloroflexota bacterium]|jgi:5,5'-dehydrodivanillate O-demethylase